MKSPLPRLLRKTIARLVAIEQRTDEQQAKLLRVITILAQTMRTLGGAA